MPAYYKYITVNPNIRFGKPCIIDTRISVYDVLKMLANDMTIEEVQHDFPELTKDQILSCLSYAADREQNIQIAS